MQDGIVEWFVEAGGGDGFLLAGVALHAEAEEARRAAVPDSGMTLALLGAGFLALRGLRRVFERDKR